MEFPEFKVVAEIRVQSNPTADALGLFYEEVLRDFEGTDHKTLECKVTVTPVSETPA